MLDSGSSDETVAIAQEFGARVFVEPWRGYGPGVNSAIDKCTGDWIFTLDADEVATPELSAEIQTLLNHSGNGVVSQPIRTADQSSRLRHSEPQYDAYWIPRLNLILGRWMWHGGVYPDPKLRLFRRGTARLREDTEPHATPKWDGPAGRLKSHMLHYAYPNLAMYLEHMDRYSTASVPLMLRRGKTSQSLPEFVLNMFLNPLATFLYNYVFRLGFLDGREGFLFHLNHSVYVNWKYVKAWQAAKQIAIDAAEPSSTIQG
ncbi:glycosyl transferase, family 2 [Acidisarcina polymorpha]|uniref:Glycosyl transferase, family 2 n=1 Tax=Acidisarcina polymorpha TaxID=2211140 RepID=A0A2Z5FU44_9BACT|nr:glycosyl transferase, family 2 [Acidisarcina polymorpha]